MTADWKSFVARQLLCLLILVVYAWMIDLKGITTDEGFRLWIINGGQPALSDGPAADATWNRVIAANAPFAYQPLYFLLQNTAMRLTDTHSLQLFRGFNLFLLWVALQGLLALSRNWRPAGRLFLLGLFSFNAFLFMHVLQIREYIAGVAFYIWTSWLVLRLDARRLERPWADTACFAAYGLALVAGFYLQSWTLFPAAAQGIFLVLRRPGDRLRHYAHLALSYVIVVAAIWPYLQGNQQKINVGLWATETEPVRTHLFNGFPLLLAGRLPGVAPLADGLFWFWVVVLAGGLPCLLTARTAAVGPLPRQEIRRQALLIFLCLGVAVAFQIGYALRIENLSLWPRYFIIHYFFLVWLTGLIFHRFLDWRTAADASPGERRAASGAAAAMAAALAVSALFQISSFRRDPMLDTSQSLASNWRVWATELIRALRPGDVVVMPDFISRATLTFTRPLAHRVLLPVDLTSANLAAVPRLVYLETAETRVAREDLVTKAGAAGFTTMQEQVMRAADGRTVLPDRRLLIFTKN